MRTLKLYPEGLPSLAEKTAPLRQDPACRRCELHQGAKTVCVPAAGQPGGLLTVGLYPGWAEDRAGIPNVGEAGRYLHGQILRHWNGPIAHTNALNCAPGDRKVDHRHVSACRPYLTGWIRQVQPTRILALGNLAIQSLLGRSPSVLSVRRGFGWYTGFKHQWERVPEADVDISCCTICGEYDDTTLPDNTCRVVPIIFLMHPAAALRQGRFAKQAFEEDLEWALREPDGFFQDRYRFLRDGTVQVPETLQEVETVFADYREAIRSDPSDQTAISWDVETRGRLHDPKTFRLVSVATCLNGTNRATVLDRAALAKGLEGPLVQALRDPELRFVEQAQYDERVAMFLWGQGRPVGIRGERRDVRLLRKLLDTTADGDLDTMSELVGQGGFKAENSSELATALKRTRDWSPRRTLMFDDCPDPEARVLLWEEMRQGGARFNAKTYLYALVPTDTLSVYNGRDVVSTGLLDRLFYPQVLERPNLRMIWEEVEGPASRSFAVSEHWGVPIDATRCGEIIRYAKSQQAALEPQLRKYCGPDLNLASPRQVGNFLFGDPTRGGLGIQSVKRTKKTQAASTDKEAIRAVADRHPFAGLYARYAYWDGYKEKAEEFLAYLRPDGRAHPTYLIDGTETGRPSSTQPNVANLRRPEDCRDCKGKGCPECDDTGIDEDSRLIRDCVYADPGYKIVECDLSQIELRGMATVCRDAVMTQAFLEDKDLHQYAAEVATTESGTEVSRSDAKPVNFGLCLAPGTPVVTRRGLVPIELVRVGDEVWTHRRRWRRVTACQVVEGVQRLYEITTRTGKRVQSTGDHLWYVAFPSANGKPARKGWVRADELQLTDYLEYHECPDSTAELTDAECRFEAIRTIRVVSHAGPVYDITVEEDHSFTAGGLLTHNCYGLQEHTLAKRLGCSVERARNILGAILGVYTGVVSVRRAVIEEVRQTGKTWTIWGPDQLRGRERRLWDIADFDGWRRQHAENAAFATLIQGSFSGDLVKEAHAALVGWILENNLDDRIQVFLSVYDSIVMRVRDDYVPLAAFMTNKFMTRRTIGWVGQPDGTRIAFPLKADCKVGQTWGRARKYKIPKSLREVMGAIRRDP